MLQLDIANLPKKDRVFVEKWLLSLIKTIQRARMEQDFTQEALAEALDVSVNTIKYIEQGRRLPSLPLMLRICKFLKIEVKIS